MSTAEVLNLYVSIKLTHGTDSVTFLAQLLADAEKIGKVEIFNVKIGSELFSQSLQILQKQTPLNEKRVAIGNKVRELRKKAGISLKNLAKNMVITSAALSMFERGKQPSKPESVLRYLEKTIQGLPPKESQELKIWLQQYSG